MRRCSLLLLLCAMVAQLWYAAPAAAAPADSDIPPPDMFQLPFPIGQAWTFNGVHGAHKEALDFSVGKPWPRWRSDTSSLWVVAVAPGSIRKTSSCGIEIDHRDGWTSVYYHVEHIIRDSGQVQANEPIANIANTPREAACEGGYATAAHLHFALKHHGRDVPINGTTLSGWRVHSGRGHYDSSCTRMYLYRGEQRLCPYTDPLLNQGIPSTFDPAPGQGDDYADESAQIEVDTLPDGAAVQGPVPIAGWAIDRAAPSGTGIDHVHLYLDGPAGQGTFLGEAEYLVERPDVAAALGDPRYRTAGFRYEWDAAALPAGQHTLFIYAHSLVADWSFITRAITVQP